MSTRRRNALVLGVAGTALAAMLVFAARERPSLVPTSAAVFVPSDAALVLTVDLDKVWETGLGVLLERESMGLVSGKDCSSTLLHQVKQVAFWVSGGSMEESGVAALTATPRKELVECARSTTTSRGGRPVTTEVDGYELLLDRGLGERAAGIAFGDRGIVLVGRDSPRLRMMETSRGRQPSVLSGEHARMRGRLGTGLDAVLSVVMVPSIRAYAEKYVDQRLPMLERVRAIAAGVGAEAGGVTIRAGIFCPDVSGCEQVGQWAKEARKSAASLVLMRVAGIGEIADGSQISVVQFEGEGLVVIEATTSIEHFVRVMHRIGGWGSEVLGVDGSVNKLPTPDEILRPDMNADAGEAQ